MSEQPSNQTGNRLTQAEAKAAPRFARSGSPDTPASGRRRSLLKAAASAAPVIATLPSGEALANASALNCVINEQTDSNAPEGAIPPPDSLDKDSYLRVVGETRVYRNNSDSSSTKIAYFIADGAAVKPDIAGTGPYDGGDILVETDGTWFDPGSEWTEDETQRAETWFLVQYYNTSTHPEPADITDTCMITGINWTEDGGPTGPTSPQHCIHPVAIKDASNLGNFPLATSCLASFG